MRKIVIEWVCDRLLGNYRYITVRKTPAVSPLIIEALGKDIFSGGWGRGSLGDHKLRIPHKVSNLKQRSAMCNSREKFRKLFIEGVCDRLLGNYGNITVRKTPGFAPH